MTPLNRTHTGLYALLITITIACGFTLVVLGKQYKQLTDLTEALADHGPVQREAIIVDVQKETHMVVLNILAQDVKITTPQYVQAQINPYASIFALTPVIENETLVGFSKKEKISMDSIKPQDRVLVSIVYDNEGVIKIARMTVLNP